MGRPLVISFFTPDFGYAESAAVLRASCERFGYEYEINEVKLDHLPTWAARCAHKGQYILEAMTRHERPLLWLDADSEIVGELPVFENPDFDFAIKRRASGRFTSATTYYSPATRKMLARCAKLCRRRTTLAHEKNLMSAWCRHQTEFRTNWLDEGYNTVYQDGPQNYDGPVRIRSNHLNGTGYARVNRGGKTLKTLVVSFHADREGHFYKSCGAKMRARCTELCIEQDIRQLEPSVNWNGTTLLKPGFILDVLRERRRPVLWVDVDCTIHSVPWAVDALDCDVAAVPYHGTWRNCPPLRIRSATIFFNYTPAAIAFLESWKRKCEVCPPTGVVGDHGLLEMTWREFESAGTCRFAHMPEPYAHISGQAHGKPVITIGLAEGADRAETMRRFAARTQAQAEAQMQSIIASVGGA